MSKNEIVVKIEGIGGFKKNPPTTITLKRGISVIYASNAVGKSSFVRALQLLFPGHELDLEDVLNEYETSGSVELQNERRFYVQVLKTADGKVKISSSKLVWDDLRAINLGFCVPNSALVRMIKENDRKGFKRWMRDISGANHYENAIKMTTNLLRDKEFEKETLEEIMQSTELDELDEKLYDMQDTKMEVDQELSKAEKKMSKLGASEETEKYEKLKKELTKKIEARNKLLDEKNKKEIELKRNLKKQDEIVKEKIAIQANMSSLEKEIDLRRKEEIEVNKHKNEINVKIYGEKTGIKAQIISMKSSSEKDQAAIDNLKSHTENEAVIGECIVLLTRRLTEAKERISELEEEKENLDEELKKYTSKLDEIKRINREIKAKRQDLLSINKTVLALEKSIPSINIRISALDDEISRNNREIDEIDGEMKRNIEMVQEITGMSEELKNTMINLQKKSRELDKKLKEIEKEKNQKLEAQEKYQDIIVSVEKLERFLNYLQERYNYIIYGVIAQLNNELKEIFKLMEYTNFSKVRIKDDPEIEIELTRKDGIITKSSRLSTSEQLTLAIMIMFVAKQAYAPDLPIFVIDEVMGSYDKTRFSRILKYIQNKVSYLVVTSLTPLEETGRRIVIEYSVP